jgi:hypothetical protein
MNIRLSFKTAVVGLYVVVFGVVGTLEGQKIKVVIAVAVAVNLEIKPQPH